MPVGVLDDDDRVVHQDADGKNQGEERYPVDRVADEHGRKKRQGERERNRDGHDESGARPQRNAEEDHHGDDGNKQVPQQFVAFSCAVSP